LAEKSNESQTVDPLLILCLDNYIIFLAKHCKAGRFDAARPEVNRFAKERAMPTITIKSETATPLFLGSAEPHGEPALLFRHTYGGG